MIVFPQIIGLIGTTTDGGVVQDAITKIKHETNYQGYQNWQMSFITCMQEFHAKNGTLPILIHLWNKALEQWFESEEEIQVATIFFSQELRHLILQHNHMDGDKYSMDVFLLSGQESKKIVILFARL
jgi:hypothetical protein